MMTSLFFHGAAEEEERVTGKNLKMSSCALARAIVLTSLHYCDVTHE